MSVYSFMRLRGIYYSYYKQRGILRLREKKNLKAFQQVRSWGLKWTIPPPQQVSAHKSSLLLTQNKVKADSRVSRGARSSGLQRWGPWEGPRGAELFSSLTHRPQPSIPSLCWREQPRRQRELNANRTAFLAVRTIESIEGPWRGFSRNGSNSSSMH